MSKDNKDNKEKSSDEGRKIKQVYLSEDGTEESKEPSKEEAGSPADNKETDTEPREPEVEKPAHELSSHEVNHRIRMIAMAAVMIVSIFVSMAVGVGLALWDSGRTLSELNMIVFAGEMPASGDAQNEVTGGSEVITPADASGEELDEVSTDTKQPGEALEESDPDDYGSTIDSDTEGLSAVSKAGNDDEIVVPDDSDIPDVLDPMSDYPRPFTTVDESYFKDALFIGDSRLQGFGFWSGLPATYYCATGFALYKYDTTKVVQTENGKVPIFDAMPYDAFTKIYIKVGLNELGYGNEENFESKYAELIAKLREYEPRAIIYVHAILPVTAAKSQSDKAHNNPNILVRNASLEKFAKSQKAYFLDAGPALSDESGSLRPEMTSDGIHLKPEYMKIWREYLCEHAVEIN